MKKLWLPAVVILLLTAPLFADGGGPLRPISESEKSYSLKMSRALGKLIPEAPAGWKEEEKPDFERFVEKVSEGSEKGLFTLSIRQGFFRETDPGAEEAQYRKTAELLKKDPSGLKSKELGKKLEALAVEFGKAVQEREASAIERINKEMETIQKEFAEVNKAQNHLMQTNLSDFMFNRNAHVSFEVNTVYHSFYNPEPFPGVSQDVIALWKPPSADVDQDKGEGDLVVVIGAYNVKKEDNTTHIELPVSGNEADHLKTKGILVRIHGSRETVEKLVKEIDFKSLKALID